MRAIPLCLLSGLLALPVQATEVQDWLRRLAEAERQQSFQGTFIYERNGSFSTHGIWHRVEEGGEVRERLLQLDGPAQEVLKVDGQAQCVSGALADQVSEEQAWPARHLDAEQLSNWYDIRVAGQSRVAGRSAVVLVLAPKDQHRYGFELHLDRATGLPLKSLLLNERGQLLERFQFTQFNTAIPDAAAMQPGSRCRPVHFRTVDTMAEGSWRSDWLPPGFTLNTAQLRRLPASDAKVAYLMYGDGLARFSVFLEPLQGNVVEDARSQLGPTVAVSRRMATEAGDVMVTVVGEIPLGTAERIALSMRAGVPEQASQ
ncbi:MULTISPECIES: MucB/RseB C-terminal domain-containing protein [Pseudomonadaceae]|jgi:sigma-E factor negative regulatory protein RseB|uniref:Sigma E regulatory protein, MucB/RseB n=2 Tax=Ectopseudomonas TaxID=3236654 RepID=A4XSB8_ECTM1|nr:MULTISPECIES: MucB/RseB C-terminal domain-containing protein [Pseudomonas]MDH0097328.1 MucB/RseB C-terminal domain-containing protein [Pseudomonas sp. GD04158]USR38377.1 MucB/RseB C-terminal domain-containing protein [Pseudomonas hydrolytica]UTH30279.1 MucB/RseB C-terminal domain-containing protein [Pseudomonas hydrolytica]